MITIASLFAAIIPMAIYLVLIWLFDRYDREPFKLVLLNYLWGAVGAIIFAIIGSSLLSTFLSVIMKSETNLELLGTIVIAPVVEEITKSSFLLLTVLNRKFDNITDGIVYGGAIGLGFGMTENFLYFIAYGSTAADWIVIVIVRTVFSAVMHCVATATFGAFLGYAKFKEGTIKIILPITGLLIAISLHFAWNYTVSFKSTALLGFVFMFLTVIIFIAVFSASVIGERRLIFRELLSEAEKGIIPFNHPQILSSGKRNTKGWIDEGTRKTYIKAATTLAFRKMQMKNSRGNSKRYYEMDVIKYREFIKNLLSN